MKINLKIALVIWAVLASALVLKDVLASHIDVFSGGSAKASEKGEYPFSVDVRPNNANAIVKIMNIGPKYKKGMILPEGKYDLKVSKHGYQSQRLWVNHKDDSPHVVRLKARN